MMGKRHLGAPEIVEPPRSIVLPEAEVTTVLHPSDPQTSIPLAVRDGQGAPVTCAACGCRLAADGGAWFHFNPIAGRDARGCRIGCADAAHDAAGRPVSIAV